MAKGWRPNSQNRVPDGRYCVDVPAVNPSRKVRDSGVSKELEMLSDAPF